MNDNTINGIPRVDPHARRTSSSPRSVLVRRGGQALPGSR
jgi:hypothetical protein